MQTQHLPPLNVHNEPLDTITPSTSYQLTASFALSSFTNISRARIRHPFARLSLFLINCSRLSKCSLSRALLRSCCISSWYSVCKSKSCTLLHDWTAKSAKRVQKTSFVITHIAPKKSISTTSTNNMYLLFCLLHKL